jgi:hypothetical protein
MHPQNGLTPVQVRAVDEHLAVKTTGAQQGGIEDLSSSSMKIMQGAMAWAWAKRSRTREAPTPTIISTNSDPLIEKNGTPGLSGHSTRQREPRPRGEWFCRSARRLLTKRLLQGTPP